MGQISVETRYCYFSQAGRHYNEHVAARYLVESRNELLMVVRLTPHPGKPTSAFRVFQMVRLRDRLRLTVDIFDDTAEYTWNELHELDGRVLFVGRGCSRSHQVADHAGFEEGFYFLDDGSFSDGDKDELLPQNSDQLQFSCTDSGRWAAPTRQIESFFPEQAPSNFSPPVWILP
uniref:KIB1-4 beta-propeller domain-containing protein n=1 Tax=Oryza brachyantha TaxID=4533 RepID=J3M9V9_ORYBR